MVNTNLKGGTHMTKLLALAAVLAAAVLTPVALAGEDCPPKPPPPCKYNCTPPPVIPPVTPPVTPPVVPPATHDCTYTGAGKDGQPGNDDCAPLPAPPATVTPPVVQPTVVVQTVTVQAPPLVTTITKVVTRVVKTKPKTRVVYRTKVVVKHVKVTVTKCAKGNRMFKGSCHAIVRGSG
jgi:hypothetical protein